MIEVKSVYWSVFTPQTLICVYTLYTPFFCFFIDFLLFNKNPISDTDINEVTIHMRKKAGCISLLLVVCA